MKHLSFLRASIPLALSSILAVACSSSTDVADEGTDDTGTGVDTGGTSGDALSDGRADSRVDSSSGDSSPVDSTSGDGTSTDSTSTDSTASDSTSTDSVATDSATADSTATDSGTSDVGTDGATTCSIDALTGKSTGCSTSEYCDAPSCTTGTCKPRPTATTDFAPACGCDHVTYWNATYAKSTGASVPSGGGGACGAGKKTCGGIASIKCPTGGTCVGERTGLTSSCLGADIGGTCWAIPSGATCSGVIGLKTYQVCGGSPKCQAYCDAVLSGHDFYNDGTGCPS